MNATCPTFAMYFTHFFSEYSKQRSGTRTVLIGTNNTNDVCFHPFIPWQALALLPPDQMAIADEEMEFD